MRPLSGRPWSLDPSRTYARPRGKGRLAYRYLKWQVANTPPNRPSLEMASTGSPGLALSMTANNATSSAPRRELYSLWGRPCNSGSDPDSWEPCDWAQEGGPCSQTACRTSWGGCRAPLIGVRCHGLPPHICPMTGLWIPPPRSDFFNAESMFNV